jgi:hypothetical protein
MVKNFAARKGEKDFQVPPKKKKEWLNRKKADIRGRSALRTPVVNWITGRSRGYKMEHGRLQSWKGGEWVGTRDQIKSYQSHLSCPRSRTTTGLLYLIEQHEGWCGRKAVIGMASIGHGARCGQCRSFAVTRLRRVIFAEPSRHMEPTSLTD